MGRLIPAGTGFEWYRHVRIPADEPPPAPPQPTEDELDMEREIEYAFDTDGAAHRHARPVRRYRVNTKASKVPAYAKAAAGKRRARKHP